MAWTRMTWKVLLLVLLMAAAFAGCSAGPQDVPEQPADESAQTALDVGIEIARLLDERDMEGLSAYVHPEKGVRLTPYAYIDTQKDRVLTADQLKAAFDDGAEYLWGAYDGTGDPITLSFEAYFDRFIYNADFADAQIIGNNVRVGMGNSLNNIEEAYPDAVFIEFHFKGFEAQYEGMDWTSLRIVLEKDGDTWRLTGIVHDQWTI